MESGATGFSEGVQWVVRILAAIFNLQKLEEKVTVTCKHKGIEGRTRVCVNMVD